MTETIIPRIRRILAPYMATPPEVVKRMLEVAEVGADDVVYDLGCGDGRLCIAAAQLFQARAVGLDIEPYWIEQSAANAAAAGVDGLVRFRVEDACDCDISEASVITLYLVHSSMQVMAQLVLSKARPGTRIVSHSFPIEGWEPDVVEEFPDEQGNRRRIFLWRMRESTGAVAENSPQ